MQKYVNLVDLVKSFPTSIYSQKSASIQPRTSLSKFGGKFDSLHVVIRLLTGAAVRGEAKARRRRDRGIVTRRPTSARIVKPLLTCETIVHATERARQRRSNAPSSDSITYCVKGDISLTRLSFLFGLVVFFFKSIPLFTPRE